ncbi:hypothetical protein Tco_0268432 [Tanacetum coccineum]
MTTLAEFMILSRADNRPLMLDKALYDSWQSRMELYMTNREHGRMILESVKHGPLVWPTIEEEGVIRDKKYAELTKAEKIQAVCDLKATNIILQGLPTNVYALVNHHRVSKDLWERIQLLMQGTSLTKQERECKLYDEFDKFAHIKGEFLPPEWRKFVMDVKLMKDLHTTNFNQLHAYLQQYELHANEVCLICKCNQDLLVLVSNHHHPLAPLAITYPSTSNQLTYPQPTSTPPVAQQTPLAELSQLDFGLAIPVFMPGDNPIAALNKMMSFLSIVILTRFPSTNNQLRTSSNPRQQATIQDGWVTIQ